MSSASKPAFSVKIDRSKLKSKGGVEVVETADGFEVKMDDVAVEKIRDQKQQMIQAIGCYNNPGGPTC